MTTTTRTKKTAARKTPIATTKKPSRKKPIAEKMPEKMPEMVRAYGAHGGRYDAIKKHRVPELRPGQAQGIYTAACLVASGMATVSKTGIVKPTRGTFSLAKSLAAALGKYWIDQGWTDRDAGTLTDAGAEWIKNRIVGEGTSTFNGGSAQAINDLAAALIAGPQDDSGTITVEGVCRKMPVFEAKVQKYSK